MLTKLVNNAETVENINKMNEKTRGLGDGSKTDNLVEKNGVDLIGRSHWIESSVFENFESMIGPMMGPEPEPTTAPTTEEMTEKDAEVDIIAREREIQKPILKYEDMYKDSVCSFFLGSITVVGLYAVYKIIGLD